MRLRFTLIFSTTAISVLKPISDPNKADHKLRKINKLHSVKKKYCEYIQEANAIVKKFKETVGCPGVSVCVSIVGNIVYNEGIGYSDVENLVPMSKDSLFRIASISKSFTSLLVGRLLDQEKINLEDDVRMHFPEFTVNKIDEKEVSIPIFSLLNHTSGIRSYIKETDDNVTKYPEMLNTKRFDSSLDACKMFQNDPLVHSPGSDYTYSTFGFTLLSAVIEKVCAQKGSLFDRPECTFKKPEAKSTELPKWANLKEQLNRLFTFLNLRNTHLEYSELILLHRTKQYIRSKNGILMNTPTVDNSYKWAGGGILSTSSDLIKFADHLASIYMNWIDLSSGAVIKKSTLDKLWKVSCVPIEGSALPGLGWFISRRSGFPATADQSHYPDRLYVLHTGGAVGGTSILLINLPIPHKTATTATTAVEKCLDLNSTNRFHCKQRDEMQVPPISVSVLVNLQDASGITQLASDLSELFLNYAHEHEIFINKLE